MSKKLLLEILGVFIIGFLIGLVFARPLGVIAPTPTGSEEPEFCIQVITPARNPQTGEIREFPTPCDVPEEWEKISSETDTSGWVVYKSTELGIQFKHPVGWIVERIFYRTPSQEEAGEAPEVIQLDLIQKNGGETISIGGRQIDCPALIETGVYCITLPDSYPIYANSKNNATRSILNAIVPTVVNI